MWKRLLDRLFPTTIIGQTEGWDIHGWKYTPHALAILAVILVIYYVMGWELP
jgi:hypothetical protein